LLLSESEVLSQMCCTVRGITEQADWARNRV